MGIELKLTDRELPVSPVFMDFLVHRVDRRPFEGHQWHDQLSEQLNRAQKEIAQSASQDAGRVMANAEGRAAIARSYELLLALLVGNLAVLKDLQHKFHFINVIGIPRNGGSYLTKELFSALGYDPTQVPNSLAHDGFPEAAPFQLRSGVNTWLLSLQTMAEYLVMVELFFGEAKRHSGKIVVPKKLTKGIYSGGFFHRVLGEAVECIFTLRHPVSSCVSTYEKSGGLPADGRFAVRSNIEEWCRRDLVYTGLLAPDVLKLDYFDAYLRYWEQYHIYVATTGLSATRDFRVAVYGKQRLESLAAGFHRRYESTATPTEFKVSEENRRRHPDWIKKSEPVIRRVGELWQRVGLPFPLAELNECW